MRPRFTERLGRGLAAALVAFAIGPAAAADRPLVLAFVPQENPEKLLGDVRAIDLYLEAAMGRRVEARVTADHAAAVESLAAGAADIAFMGALPYVMARERIGAAALLSEVYRGKPSYSGAVFVRRGSGISSLEDLRGKSIAFADPISESGFLYPLDLFVKAGLLAARGDPRAFFGEVYFAGGYQQAIQAVANGLVDAAGVSVYATLLLDAGRRGEVAAIARTPPIPSHVVVARRGLDPELRAAFLAAMLALNAPAKRHLLKHLYGPEGYVVPDRAAYDGVAAMARKYGLIR
ncbi:MAG: phosphate/phosphite/phosphonate ABC transporter substrate-binding protein [Defluviicoccus sp.]|nr:phosphate/phosphite/phosphonate ABC transporter substrate-binding protein [Defluviicoccus sp.]MDE0278314.1 phosphate/phosphite/phosphonate ABC transporter substrate-binding protein [Defluviicoccus sp.]